MKPFRYLLLFACFIPLFIFRDFTPNNELKYLSIADEALQNGNIFTFWNHGMVYADKPPLYLWIIMLGKWLFGIHSMAFIGMFSMIPALLILYVMDKWISDSVPENIRLSGQLMLITSGLFIGSAVVARMDMLMSLFIILSLYTFYKLYTGCKKKIDKILLPVYIFLAVFSKGPVGFLVPLLSIFIFLLLKKEIRSFGKYLGWISWSILLGLCAIWFGGVYLEGGKSYLDNLLFNQTVNRAIDSFHHKEPVYYYFKTIWYSLAPWVLFYVVTIIIGIKKGLINSDLKKLFLTIITVTFIALSVFSGKLDIYMLPIFPFFTYLALLIIPEIRANGIFCTIAIPAGILTLVFPVVLITSFFIEIPVANKLLAFSVLLILSGTSVLSLVYLYRKKFYLSINSLAIGLLLTIFTGSFAIPGLNKNIGFGEIAQHAEQHAKKNNTETYYCYDLRSGENMDIYLKQKVTKITIEEIERLGNLKKCLLFMETKDSKSDAIQNYIKNKDIFINGTYCFIVFE